MKSIVITGPTGTIGMALIDKCIKERVDVLALCRKESTNIDRLPVSEFVRVMECDLSELKQFNVESQYDVFYHLAWDGTIGEERNNSHIQSKNVEYTLGAVQLAARLGCHTFIGAGSQAEYGRVEGKLSPKTATNPENAYGIAKLEAGQKSLMLCHELGLKHIWTRILSVYGPNDDENTMVMWLINQLLNEETPMCTEGDQTWDYLYSEDAANALFLLGEKGHDGKVYCLGSGEARPLKQYINIIKSIINEDAEIKFGAIPYREAQVMNLCADISDLKRDVGFSPTIRFEDGIKIIMQSLLKSSKDE